MGSNRRNIYIKGDKRVNGYCRKCSGYVIWRWKYCPYCGKEIKKVLKHAEDVEL